MARRFSYVLPACIPLALAGVQAMAFGEEKGMYRAYVDSRIRL